MLFNHIDELERTYTDLGEQINDPDIIANQEKWQKLMKEYSNMGPVVEKYREYKNALKSAEEAEEMLKESKDEEFRELLKEELTQSKEDAEKFREELKVLLLPKDPNDSKNVIMEIRAGTGGNEAAIFAGELFRMYVRYAENRKHRHKRKDRKQKMENRNNFCLRKRFGWI